MLLDLNGLLKEKGVRILYSENVYVEVPKEEIDIVNPVNVNLEFTNTGDGLWMQGKIVANVHLNCSRCLENYVGQIVAVVEERLKKQSDVEEDDIVYEIDEHGNLDLTEVIRQSLIMNIPIKTLCSESCDGIEIEEVKKLIDPRLEKLKQIKL